MRGGRQRGLLKIINDIDCGPKETPPLETQNRGLHCPYFIHLIIMSYIIISERRNRLE